MSALRIRLFGHFSLCCDGEALEDLIPAKAKELLCHLLVHGQRPMTREYLASILWHDCTAERSKQYFRKALWQLQRVFDEPAVPVLQVDLQCVSVNPNADIWVDVVEFERSCSAAQGSSCEDGVQMEALEAAVDLYQGDLLEGWYQDWCLYDRERLQNIYLVVLDKLVACSEESCEYEKGVNYAARILRCDRANERAHQHIMRLRYLSGDRTGALRQYESCAAALREELDVQPLERTHELYRQIRADSRVAIAPGSKSDLPESDEDPLQGTLKRLEDIKAALAALQSRVDESLLRVSQALRSSNRYPSIPNRNRSWSSD
jgi:DNA-binding SARP family transcriptional activator